MKKITNLSLALIMTCLCTVFDLHAQFSGGGRGTADDPFQIKTADDLNNVRNYIGSSNAGIHFRLMNDIDLTTFLSSYNEGWLPIGTGYYNGHTTDVFAGYFHGGGHTVSGLWINNSTYFYIGFFGLNLGIIDSLGVAIADKNITGTYWVGGLIGYNEGPITACHVEGPGGTASNNSDGNPISGGFIGENMGGTISNCYATVNSTATSFSSQSGIGYEGTSGGFIGVHNGGTISDCYATGNSTSTSTTGSPPYTVSVNSFSGGFVGQLQSIYDAYTRYSDSNISNCYAAGVVTSNSNNTHGAFAGECENATYVNFSKCYFNSDINGLMSAVGNNIGIENVFGKTTAEMKMQATFADWDFSYAWAIKEGSSYPYLQWQNSSPTGIQTIPAKNNSMPVYPNPTDGIVYINCEINVPIQVYSLSGSLILQSISQSEKASIDLSAYPKGIYLVKAGNKYARVIRK